jgi:hypothetical protein
MKYVSALISFAFVFAAVFLMAGLFLMPFLPPIPDRPISALEEEYWLQNWAGLVLGLLLGTMSARSVLKKAKPHIHAESGQEQQQKSHPVVGGYGLDLIEREDTNIVVTTFGKFRKVRLKALGMKEYGMYRGRGMLYSNDEGIGIDGRHIKSLGARLGIAIVLIVASVVVTVGMFVIGVIPIYLLVEYVFLDRESVFIPWSHLQKYAFDPKRGLVAVAFEGPPRTSPVVMYTPDLPSVAQALREMAPDKDATAALHIGS